MRDILGNWFLRVRRAFRVAWQRGPVERVYLLLVFCIVASGVVMRSWGMLFGRFPFWLDECSWGVFLMEQPLRDLIIRPIGFMAVSKVIATLWGPTETALRFVPWMAGVATTLLSPFLAQRLFVGRAARLLFVAALASNAEAVNYAKEFKPYSLGLLLHCTLLLLALKYLDTQRMRDLCWALALSVVAVLFTQDIIFAYPGALLAMAIQARRAPRSRELIATAAAGAMALSLVVAQYVFIWSKLDKGESDYWGQKYDVFFIAKGAKSSHLSWFLGKVLDIAAFPGIGRLKWHSTSLRPPALANLVTADARVWLALCLVGVASIVWRRRALVGLMLVTPLLTLSVLSTIGLWPFGAFRTNLFVLAYVCPIAAMALDWPARSEARAADAASARVSGAFRSGLGLLSLTVPLVLLVAPLFFFDDTWLHQPHGPSRTLQVPQIVDHLIELQHKRGGRKRELLILDPLHCEHWRYYTKYNPVRLGRSGPELERRFTTVCAHDDREAEAGLRSVSSAEDRVWILTAMREGYRLRAFYRALKEDFRTEHRSTVEASITLQVRKRP